MPCRSAETFDRVECYLDGPESSLEYWKQEKREKPLGDWSLNTIKTSRQSVTHTHIMTGNYPIISIYPTQYLFLSHFDWLKITRHIRIWLVAQILSHVNTFLQGGLPFINRTAWASVPVCFVICQWDLAGCHLWQWLSHRDDIKGCTREGHPSILWSWYSRCHCPGGPAGSFGWNKSLFLELQQWVSWKKIQVELKWKMPF